MTQFPLVSCVSHGCHVTYCLGCSINVSISTDNSTVIEKKSFNFTCSSHEVNATYVVYVDGSERHDRVTPTTSTNMSQSFSYENTTFHDNGRQFQCLANKTINGKVVVFKSPIITINVLCKFIDTINLLHNTSLPPSLPPSLL